MKHSALFLAVLGLLCAASTTRVDYSGHMVIRVVPETRQQLAFLRRLESAFSLDFWSMPRTTNNPADIRVSPESYGHLVRSLADKGLSHVVRIKDIGELERREQKNIADRRAQYADRAFDFANYHPYEEIVVYLDELAKSNPLVTTKSSATITEQSRNIVQLIISSGGTNKPVIFFDCNIHAREWITSATCLWIIDHLANGYGTNTEITRLIDTYDWKFIPVANPDGLAHTWNADRLWRKNRRVNAGFPGCPGVDANRNFPVGFGADDGSSSDPCDETYRGPQSLSERESIAIRDFALSDQGLIKAAISIHSYSQLWMSPFGCNNTLPTEYDEMLRVMKIGVDALHETFGTVYAYGNLADTIYVASGITTDFYYGEQNITHSYTIELRDTGLFGFELPPNQILTTAAETWNGLKAFVQAL